jgi:hypothetical protein
VLVGRRTRAGTRGVRYERRDSISVKGKRSPIEAHAAVGVDGAAPARGIEGLSAPMIGREDELTMLRAVVARAARERAPQLVTLFGQAGIGKSRLLGEVVGGLPAAAVLSGRCLPYGDGITYWPLAEAAKGFAGILESDDRDVARAKLRTAVETILGPEHALPSVHALSWTIGLPPPGETSPLADPAHVRSLLTEGWERFLAALGRRRLTILLVEDVHWASGPLLDLLDHLADTLTDSAVVLACSTRPELLDARPGWGAGKLNATALELRPLRDDDSLRLISELLAADATGAEFQARVLERAEGNPFYVEEILRMLIDQGALERVGDTWSLAAALDDVPIPDSVHGVLAARIDLLDPVPREALRRCAVVGRVFWPVAVGVDEELIASLARRGLVSANPTSSFAGRRELVFKHALTRDVAYGTLPHSERRLLHRRVAEWLGEVAPDREAETAELAAYHYCEAIAYGEDDRAVIARAARLLLTAGEAALARAAYGTAATLLGRALELADATVERMQVQLVLAVLDVMETRFELALERLGEVERVARENDPRLLAETLGWRSRLAWLMGRWEEAHAAAAAAVEALADQPESPQLARALARRSQIEMLEGLPSAVESSDVAVAVARRVGDLLAEVNARINLFTARANDGIPPDIDVGLELAGAAAAGGLYDEAARAVVNLVWSGWPYGPLDRLEDAVERGREVMVEIPPPETIQSYLELTVATLLLLPAARWDELDEFLRSPPNLEPPNTRMLWLGLVGGMAMRRGDLAGAAEPLEELRILALESAAPQRVIPMANLLLPQAALAEDLATLRRRTDEILGAIPTPWPHVFPATSAVRAAAALGETALVERLAGVLPAGGESANVAAGATRTVAAGLLALAEDRPERAIAELESAVGLVERFGRTYEAACLRLELARAHEAAGANADGAAARSLAAAVLEPLGCVNPF